MAKPARNVPDRPRDAGSSPRTAILVLGMHRSGTSALARVVNLLGANLGSRLMPAHEDNAAGFWEHHEIVQLHDELFETLGTRWDDDAPLAPDALLGEKTQEVRGRLREIVERDFAEDPCWGLKDPRLCRIVPLWTALLEELGCEPRFVLTCRDPREVAASLASRNGLPAERSGLLWLDHCLSAERDTRGHRRAFVGYEQLMTDWRPHVARIGRQLDLPWADAIPRVESEVDSFLDPGLRHHDVTRDRPDAGPPDAVLSAWLRSTHDALRQATDNDGDPPRARLDGIREAMTAARALYQPWITRLEEKVEQLESDVRDRDTRIARLRNRPPAVSPTPAGTSPAAAAPATGSPAIEPPAEPSADINITHGGEKLEGAPRVSIVIPLFNKVELTAKCLESLSEHTPDGSYEVILVDNASTDDTPKLLACLEGNVKVVTNEKNLGFSQACNQGARVASTDYVLFLNNDIEAKDGWLEPLLEILDRDPSVAATGSKLLFPDGTIQHAGVALLSNPLAPVPLGAFHVHYGESADFPDANVPSEYQVLTGACLLVRRSVLEEVGGFDTYFWNGCEDIDLCLKIQEKGWKLVYQPASVLIHHESQSGPERYSRARTNENLLCSRWLGKVEADLVAGPDGSRRRTEAQRIRPYVLPSVAREGGARGREAPDVLTSIIVLTRNQRAHTRLCWDSLVRHTNEPHEVVFVDNGSTDGTVEWLRDLVRGHENVRVVRNATNLGFAGGNNLGLSLARGRTIVLLNNDTVVTRGWLGGLMTVLEEHPDVGIVGPMTNYASGPQVVKDVPYRTLPQMDEFAEKWRREHAGESEPARRLVGFCWLLRREVVDAVGGLDERFGSGNCEDDDFCVRAFQAGWRAHLSREVFIHHTGSQTFKSESIDYAQSLRANFELFKEKWEMEPSWRVEDGYPFLELVAKGRRPKVVLPDLGSRHAATMGGRWFQEGSAEFAAPVTPTRRTLRVGVLPGGAPSPEMEKLFTRHGHSGPIPVWETASDIRERLREPGLVLLLAHDVALTDEALQELVEVADSDDAIAAVGPLSNAAPAPQRMKGSYRNLGRGLERFVAKRRRKHRGATEDVSHLGGFCLLLRAEATERVGGLPDEPLPDAIFRLFGRLRDQGRRVVCAKGAYVHHSKLAEEEGASYDELAAAAPREAVRAG